MDELKESLLPAEQGGANADPPPSGRVYTVSKTGEWHPDTVLSKEDRKKVYANNQPKIMLEVLSARTTMLILVLTYTVAIIGFKLDFTAIQHGFEDNELFIPSVKCSFGKGRVPQTLIQSNHSLGCYNGTAWYGLVKGINNVINVELEANMLNMTYWPKHNMSDISFSVELWACYLSDGCDQKFADNSDTSYDKYHMVLDLADQSAVETAVSTETLTNMYTSTIIDFTFQNQESIPTSGIIKSYYMEVHYTSGINPFTPQDAAEARYLQYEFDFVNRPHYGAIILAVLVLMCFTFLALLFYLFIMIYYNKGRKWLPEQRWLILYLCLVIIFQNPIYITLFFTNNQKNVDVVYASYVFDAIGQVGFFVVWLMFAAAVRRRSQSLCAFYAPKLVFGAIIFATYMVILTYQFPNLFPNFSDRSPVESVRNWATYDQGIFVGFSLFYVALLVLWSILWFASISWSGRLLGQLPYMSTRYLQLSYRFFSLQATLVTCFYVLQYASVIYQIIMNSRNDNFGNITTLAEDTNTIFRQQTQLFGKNLFLTIYALVLTFVCLPPDFMSGNEYMSNLQVSYVINEHEALQLIKARKQAMHRRNRMQQSFFTTFVPYKLNIFCAQLAETFGNLSFEAYYDPPGMITKSGFGHDPASLRELDPEKYDYKIVRTFYDPEHDTFCCICRHTSEPKIVVMFRGTSSRTHWNDNLNFRKMRLDTTNAPSAEAHEGLEVPAMPKDPFIYRQLNKAMRVLNIFAHDDEDSDDEVRTFPIFMPPFCCH